MTAGGSPSGVESDRATTRVLLLVPRTVAALFLPAFALPVAFVGR